MSRNDEGMTDPYGVPYGGCEEPWIDEAEYYTGMSWAEWRGGILSALTSVATFISVPNYLWEVGPHGWFNVWGIVYFIIGAASSIFTMIGVHKIMEA